MHKFQDVRLGGSFTHDGYNYLKLSLVNRERYGWTNAKGPAFYEGDTGYRHFYDEQEVIILCDECIRTFGDTNALPATTKLEGKSILFPGKMLFKYACDEHAYELWEKGWESC